MTPPCFRVPHDGWPGREGTPDGTQACPHLNHIVIMPLGGWLGWNGATSACSDTQQEREGLGRAKETVMTKTPQSNRRGPSLWQMFVFVIVAVGATVDVMVAVAVTVSVGVGESVAVKVGV